MNTAEMDPYQAIPCAQSAWYRSAGPC